VPSAGTSPLAGGPGIRLVYDGRIGELYKIFAVNFLLGLITLGIYRFWGKTRMRRYLWSHLSYDGDRFEYTGTGGELFKGFLIVAVILILLTLVNTGAQFAIEILVRDPAVATILFSAMTVTFYVVLFFLIFVGQYTALRYRLTRTRWRAIRGGLAGSAWRYGVMSMGFAILKLLTLGQFTPFAEVRLWRYRICNAFFGTAQARFTGSGREVYKPFLISFLASIAATAAALGGAWLLFGERLHSDLVFLATNRHLLENEETQSLFLAGLTDVLQIIGMFIAFSIIASLVSLIAHCWYWTKLLSLLAQGTTIAGLTFRTGPRTSQLWWLVAGNTLISLFTLGLGHPFVLQRLWRFLSTHLEIVGTVDGTVIAQSRLAAPTRGEGLLEALDPGAF
jgi:uncharacterized membrane protein YjgN (DUF898 family)